MALVKPPLEQVSAGRPVTAQGWNAIVDGLSALYDAVLALGTSAVQVSITFEGRTVTDARVVAEPLSGTGNPVVAVGPFGSTTNHLLVGVGNGNWRIHVDADGFRPEVREVTVPLADTLTVTLTRAGVLVPDLFGQPAQQALTTLGGLGLLVDLILDATGHEVSRVSLPPTYQNAPVLMQVPDAGTTIDPATGRVRLVLAAALQFEETVTMPSLVGLTYDEVVTALNQLGLKVGRTTMRSIPVSR
jgi:hypothetical protein